MPMPAMEYIFVYKYTSEVWKSVLNIPLLSECLGPRDFSRKGADEQEAGR